MRPVNPYNDSIYDSAPGHVNPLAVQSSPTPKRTSSKKTAVAAHAATLLGTTPPPPNHHQTPLLRANIALQPSPLQARDPNQHVLSLTSATSVTRLTTKDVLTMPPSEKPRQPQLSAGAARGMNRTPLTPKVAVLGPPAGTPLAKKSTFTIANVQTPHKDDRTTNPGSYFTNHNVTPRSGPRQTRVDSTNTTPTGTPNLDKTGDGWDNNGRGLGLSPLGRSESFGSRRSLGESPIESKADNKFFYASDAKPSPQPSQSRPTSINQKNTPTFFYASDASTSNKRSSNPPTQSGASTPSLSSGQDGATSKFFYANGTPDVDPRLSLHSTGSGSSASNSSKVARPNTSNAVGFGTPPIHSRPASPIKAPLQPPPPQQAPRTSVNTPTSPNRGPVFSPPILAPKTTEVGKRRVSIEVPSRLKNGHARAGSVPSMDNFTAPRVATPSLSPPEQPALSTNLDLAQPAMTMASILQMAEELGEDEEDEEAHSGDSESESHSPKKSSQSSDPVSHLVLSARRERKVQDLEIRNASLEAINRTLERQMRKQKAELRRFRRMSRAGRLPGSSVASSRVVSLTISEAPTDLTDVAEGELELEPDIEEEEEEEDEDSLDDSDSSSEENGDQTSANPLSPSSRRRKREERRLQLDLTKHQELLIDSQKMNQSLKRCLDWTEELIKEGQKALAYHVRVSDVDELPGRVLAPAYYDYRDDTSNIGDDTVSNLSVSHFSDDTISNVGSELEPWMKGPQDRDSGIELPGEGS